MSISTKEELQYLLHRAWEIEKKFESLSAWNGFVSLGQPFRSTVLTLARESYNHRLDLEKLLKTLNLEAPKTEIPEGVFDFAGILDLEAIQRIVENDEMVKDLYTKIVDCADPKLVAVLSGETKVEFFYQTLKRIIEDETRHISMVKNVSGRINRIQ